MVQDIVKVSFIDVICLDNTLSHSLQASESASTNICLPFRGPRIMIYSYNKTQQDAQFLKFI